MSQESTSTPPPEYEVPSTTEAGLTIAADVVGGVSVLLGGILLAAPWSSGWWLGLDDTSVLGRRALGAADVGLGVAIIAGRSAPWRWRAVAARSALHLVFAVAYARGSRTGHAAGMIGLFAIDAGVAVGLRPAVGDPLVVT